jgi:hypothetical protein
MVAFAGIGRIAAFFFRKRIGHTVELETTETAASEFDEELHKLIKRAKKAARNALAFGRFQTRTHPC